MVAIKKSLLQKLKFPRGLQILFGITVIIKLAIIKGLRISPLWSAVNLLETEKESLFPQPLPAAT
jgi:hypothetical protein